MKGAAIEGFGGDNSINTITNMIEIAQGQQFPQEEEPIKLMNLRLPIRKDFSDSQTNLAAQDKDTL